MTLKIKRSFSRRFIRTSLVIIGVFLLGLTCLHIWFVHNADRFLVELVNKKSGGKLKLELSRASFDFFSSEVKIHEAKITSTGEDKSKTTYQVSFQKITFSTNSIWAVLFKKSLEIKKIKLYDPVIEIFNQKKDSADSKSNLSLGNELGKIYHTIEDAITALNTHSISLINAKLIINNKAGAHKEPLIFSNIYFSITKLNKHKNSPGKYLSNNNILFSSSDQDISFTDGIHKLLFKRLVIQRAKNIILDSCTIISLPTQVLHSSYNIYFKRLALIGVDFDTWYKTNIIKADSVYCTNSVSSINLNGAFPDSNKAARKLPDPQKIIKDFAGNLDLGFLGFIDGDIHLNIKRRKTQSNIHSGKLNFQIKNLRINPDSSNPVTIKTFDMLIKGYQLYNADSSCVYAFDSIRFANDKLLLNSFSVHTASGADKIRSFRNYTIPYFELLGVDWPELIFKQNLKAKEAILHDATIDYRKIAKPFTAKKTIIFNSHRTFDDFMEIDRLKIVNGKISMKWGDSNSLQLEGFNLNLFGNNLTDYKHVRLQKDIEFLFFSKGFLKIGGTVAQLREVIFRTNNLIHAKELLINNAPGGLVSKIENVSIKNIYSEEDKGDVVIDGLQWEKGTITINSIPHPKENPKAASILLKNISAKHTQFKFTGKGINASAYVEDARISSLLKSNSGPVVLKGLNLKGRELNFFNAAIRMNSESFILSDKSQHFSGTRFEKSGYGGSFVMKIPSIHLTDNISSFFINDFHFKNISLKSPVIDFQKQNNRPVAEHNALPIPAIKIDHIAILEPAVNVLLQQDVSVKKFSLPYSTGSEIKADDVEIAPEGINVAALHINTQKAEIIGTKKDFRIDDGIDVNLSNIHMPPPGNSPSWMANLTKLSIKDSLGFTFNIKKNKLWLKDITVGDAILSSSSINNIDKLINSNRNAWVSTSAAKYATKNSLWQFFDMSYNAANKMLVLDSINYHPSIPRDSFIALNPHQVDYIHFSLGNTRLYEFDMIKDFNGDSLEIKRASISNPSIIVFRDKLPPFLPGIRKELFTEKIRNIKLPLSIKQIDINDGNVSYTEKDGKNRLEGTVILSHLNGTIYNFTNYDVQPRDSLSLAFTGHLLNDALFNLKLHQSYTDPLFGFRMSLRIEPVSLAFLNPLLAPLSNVKFASGNIDKFEMNVKGNENVAHGEMKFQYHGLHIQLLKNGEIAKSTFIKSTESTLINAFVLKTNNQGRTGLIYFKRLKDRSFFNYVNKIIFTGVSTSVGVKKNSRYKKKIARETSVK